MSGDPDAHLAALLSELNMPGHSKDGTMKRLRLAKQKLAFVPAGRAGTLAVVAVAGGGKAKIVDTVPTQVSARTIALDERTGRLYLPAAKYGPPATAGGRPTLTPGTFEVLVVGK